MSIRRAFQIVTFVVAVALPMSVVTFISPASACDPLSSSAGLCG